MINIRILEVEDVSKDYVNWFSKKEIIEFSDNQYLFFSLEKQKEYVHECLISDDKELYGIFDDDIHIGNIIMKNINKFHCRAEIGYVIGDKNYWGKGYGKKAVFEIIGKAKNKHHLTKLYAGVASANIASIKVLENNKFVLEGIRKKHLKYNKLWFDQLDYGVIL